MSVKIDSFEIENVKRVKAVAMEPAPDGLTVIGGANSQGKTSILDAIAWALGGERYRPSDPKREGSATDPHLRVVLSNGLVVERKGKNSDLKVIDPEGRKGGQSLLNSFVEELALNLPKFLEASDKEKAQTLLNIIGVGPKLAELETQEDRLKNQRLAIGQLARQKRGSADEMQSYPDAPQTPVSVAELVQQQQAILAKNGENQRLRENATKLIQDHGRMAEEIRELSLRLDEKRNQFAELDIQVLNAQKSAEQLTDESTAEIEESIASIEETNARVRTNQAKASAELEADELEGQYKDFDTQIDAVRDEKLALLDGADMPLDGLTVDHGELTYNGQRWDNMSSSEQLKAATAIVRKLKPECGFVLLDKLEQLDQETLTQFGAWCQTEGLQVIGTRVSVGDECSILISDGYAAGAVRSGTESVLEAKPAFNFNPEGGF